MADLISILGTAVKMGASDIHIVVDRPPMIRLHGDIDPISGQPTLNAEDTKKMIYSVLYEGQRARFEEDMELDCSLAVTGVSRFRVNVYQQRKGVGAVFRVIPAKIPTQATACGGPPFLPSSAEVSGVTNPPGSCSSPSRFHGVWPDRPWGLLCDRQQWVRPRRCPGGAARSPHRPGGCRSRIRSG